MEDLKGLIPPSAHLQTPVDGAANIAQKMIEVTNRRSPSPFTNQRTSPSPFLKKRRFEGKENERTLLKEGIERKSTPELIFYKDGSRYEGTIKNGYAHGFGRLIFPNGIFYLGEFQEGKPHGKGMGFVKTGKYHEEFHIGNWVKGYSIGK